jgi:hypothetical protein
MDPGVVPMNCLSPEVVMVEINLSAFFRQHSPTLYAKIIVRYLDFYYGETRALKDIWLPLYANRTTCS